MPIESSYFRHLQSIISWVTFLLLFLFPVLVQAQVKSTGIPEIKNYPKSVYEAGTQNWGIAQDKNGFMYFANNDGLLRFDGIHWDLLPVSNTSPVRSVAIDSSNNTYVGLLNDFGVFEKCCRYICV